MVTNSTVFILGAGASAPYGFPTGKGLVSLVLSNLNDQVTVDQIVDVSSEDESLVISFRNALARSGKYSVDAFLERRPEFLEVGKIAIAQALIPFENESGLFSQDVDGWYRYVYNQMDSTLDEFANNKVAFITYNYDRSLEYYLHTALKNTYNLSDEKSALILDKVPVVHLHGRLGYLAWQSDPKRPNSTRPFDMVVDKKTLGLSANVKYGINIVFEESIDRDPEFEKAFELIANANTICFLGFGYAPTNIKRLKPETWENKVVLGTTIHMYDKQIESALKLFPYNTKIGAARYGDILAYLQNIVDLS